MSTTELKPFRFYKINAKGNEQPSPSNVPRYVNVPKARSGHRSVTDCDGNIYSFGGYNPHVDERDEDMLNDEVWGETNPLFKELWKFNSATLTWTKLKTRGEAPIQLASHCAILVNNFMIVYGGTGIPFGANSSNQIHICNLRTLEWQLLKVNEQLSVKPEEQYGQAIVYDRHDNALYTIGGTNGLVYSIDIHKFDFKTKVWSDVWVKRGNRVGPRERYRHEAVLYNDRIYIFGGGTATTSFDFKRVPVFNLVCNEWEYLETKKDTTAIDDGFPMKRRCHGCVCVDSEVFIIGGLNNTVICKDMWKLDLETRQWTMIPYKMPLPVYFHSASVSPFAQMTIFGGVTSFHHNLRTNNLFQVWLKIPPLKEIAWNTLLANFRNTFLTKMSPVELFNLGIPLQYIQRLSTVDNEMCTHFAHAY
ncbi:Kelch domain-containing protein 10-like protein [Leptotrombidium deliense]|uniref:Kelch domain-containing protein 10 n=1 Tax=Leptotrombidium deliense TaxID=299467 RepID=A0A443ST12_9ACAR|nr:Kelch domain-containing protein 10-like protein [Leptotrombidium deliense]